jgi:peptidyl-tRNA hydrolase, PTH1 family
MVEENIPLLIVCLGNPGENYEHTRHNIGFLVGDALVKHLGSSRHHKKEFLGELAQGYLGAVRLFVLFPGTYMNLSGQALRRCMDFFKIPFTHVIVVCDDVALPFGKLRLRDRGSSGGHNGLKSIEETLGSQEYDRLKIGVGREEDMNLADFVLGQFKAEEFEQLPGIIEHAKGVILAWAQEGYSKAVERIVPPRKKIAEGEKTIIKDENKNWEKI